MTPIQPVQAFAAVQGDRINVDDIRAYEWEADDLCARANEPGWRVVPMVIAVCESAK